MFPNLEFIKTCLNAITAKFRHVKSDVDAVKSDVDAVKNDKINKKQSASNAGKFLVVGADGVVKPDNVVVPERHVVLINYDSSTKKYTVNQSYSTMKQWLSAGDTVVLSLGGAIYNLCEQVDGDRLVFAYVRSYNNGQIKLYTASVYTKGSVAIEFIAGYMMPNNNATANGGLIPVATKRYTYELTDLSNVVIKSSTEGSTKKFKLSVEDSGTIKTINTDDSTEVQFAKTSDIPAVDSTLSQIGQAADAKAVGDALAELEEKIPGSGSGVGLSADEKTLLLTLVKNAKYAENVQPAYEQLEALFNGGAIVTYTVTNNLTDLTTDNEAATITAGFPYKATLADADGNKPTSVEVVMGGVDVSGEYYADGVIDIPSVSGELVITAFAKNTYPVIYNLANTPVTCNADLYEDTGLAFGSESADGYTKSWTMVVRVKNASAGYLWCVNGQKALSSWYENRWNSDAGDKVMTINTYICNTRVSSGITQANPDEVCIVITKEALSEKTATVHYLSWAGEYAADTVTGTYAQFFNSAYAANMMIGGQKGADFVGTIEEFVIYEGIMEEYEIKAVLGV